MKNRVLPALALSLSLALPAAASELPPPRPEAAGTRFSRRIAIPVRARASSSTPEAARTEVRGVGGHEMC